MCEIFRIDDWNYCTSVRLRLLCAVRRASMYDEHGVFGIAIFITNTRHPCLHFLPRPLLLYSFYILVFYPPLNPPLTVHANGENYVCASLNSSIQVIEAPLEQAVISCIRRSITVQCTAGQVVSCLSIHTAPHTADTSSLAPRSRHGRAHPWIHYQTTYHSSASAERTHDSPKQRYKQNNPISSASRYA